MFLIQTNIANAAREEHVQQYNSIKITNTIEDTKYLASMSFCLYVSSGEQYRSRWYSGLLAVLDQNIAFFNEKSRMINTHKAATCIYNIYKTCCFPIESEHSGYIILLPISRCTIYYCLVAYTSYSLLFVQWVFPQRPKISEEKGEKESRRWWQCRWHDSRNNTRIL